MQFVLETSWRTRWDNPDMDIVRSVIEELKHRPRTMNPPGFNIVLTVDYKWTTLDVSVSFSKVPLLAASFADNWENLLMAEAKDWTEVENLCEAFLNNDMGTVKKKFTPEPDHAPPAQQLNPLLERAENFEKIISEHISNGMVLKKFELEYDLTPSEKTVNKLQTMLQTPEPIKNQLKENEIGLYKVQSLNMTFVSNKWRTIFLTPNDEKKLIFYDVLPTASGEGNYSLYLGDMSFRATRETPSLLNLVQAIEAETGLKFKWEQHYDD